MQLRPEILISFGLQHFDLDGEQKKQPLSPKIYD
jgi:hypothetical protein